ncbi:MAG TPA: SAM-dependent DNA methyltransferase [Syntrophomonas sp.]|nr:SAM-dependent DNA methyltransferase [Syntrophomonas sp.]
MKGNILANRSSPDRPETEYYPTPSEVTQALLNYLDLPQDTIIWEPACGAGFMAEVFQKAGYKVIASDLNDFGYGFTGLDFIGSRYRECDWIITNPPFKLSVEFIEQCLKHGKPFALLLKSQYWHSKNRIDVFNKFKPQAVLPLTWRPDFLFKKKGGSPTMECIWTIWGAEPAITTKYQPLKKPSKILIKEATTNA